MQAAGEHEEDPTWGIDASATSPELEIDFAHVA